MDGAPSRSGSRCCTSPCSSLPCSRRCSQARFGRDLRATGPIPDPSVCGRGRRRAVSLTATQREPSQRKRAFRGWAGVEVRGGVWGRELTFGARQSGWEAPRLLVRRFPHDVLHVPEPPRVRNRDWGAVELLQRPKRRGQPRGDVLSNKFATARFVTERARAFFGVSECVWYVQTVPMQASRARLCSGPC